MIYDLAVSQIFRSDLFHFFLCQRKIPDIDILFHTLHMDGFRNDRYTALCVPAENNLRCALIIFLSDLHKFLIRKDTVFAFCKRAPCLRDNAVCFHIFKRGFLYKERVEFHLVYSRDHFYVFTEICKDRRIERSAVSFRRSRIFLCEI